MTDFTTEDLANPFGLLLRADVHADPYPAYKFMRENAPVLDGGGGMWFITSHEHVGEALSSTSMTTSYKKVMGVLPMPDDLWTEYYDHELLFTDTQRHTWLRKFANEAFKPRRIRQLRPQLEADVDAYLDRVADSGEMDMVADLAQPFTMLAVMRMIGIPAEDADQVHRWSAAMGALLDPVKLIDPVYRAPGVEAFGECIDHIHHLMEQRRKDPQDDVLSDFVASLDSGDGLTDKDIMGIVIRGMINAGHATTTNQTGNDLLALLDHPDQLAKLRESPALAPTAIEELFRYDSTIQMTVRCADEDFELGGQNISEGHLLWLFGAAANRDPAVFVDPDAVEITRTVTNSFASGGGEHYCLGATLARLETEIALMKVLERFTDIELKVPANELPRDNNVTIRGVESMPISFKTA